MIDTNKFDFYDFGGKLIDTVRVNPNIVAMRKTVRLIQFLDRFFKYDAETGSYRETEGVFPLFTVVG